MRPVLVDHLVNFKGVPLEEAKKKIDDLLQLPGPSIPKAEIKLK